MIGLIAVTAAGRAAAERLAAALPYARRYDGPAATALPQAFAECDAIVSFLAVGATVRIAAPLITGKYEDPGIVCVDEALRYAIPVLGGHAGGANVLARRVAGILGATAVISTASEASGSVGLDEFGADLGFVLEPGSALAAVGAAILSGERVTLTMQQQWPVPALPPNVVRTAHPEPGVAAIVVSDEVSPPGAAQPAADAGGPGPRVTYRPPSLVVGAGASTGVTAAEAGGLIDEALAAAGLSPKSVRWLATADPCPPRARPSVPRWARRALPRRRRCRWPRPARSPAGVTRSRNRQARAASLSPKKLAPGRQSLPPGAGRAAGSR